MSGAPAYLFRVRVARTWRPLGLMASVAAVLAAARDRRPVALGLTSCDSPGCGSSSAWRAGLERGVAVVVCDDCGDSRPIYDEHADLVLDNGEEANR